MKKIFLAALATTTLFASCAKEGGNATPEGETTRMGLSFSFPGAATRAIVDDNATVAESVVTDVTVFIFDNSGTAVTGNATTVAIADFDATDDNEYTLKEVSKIVTTTGARRIYVGMNLPASMSGITSEAALKAEMNIVMTDLATAATGMAMFSTEVSTVNLVLDETLNMVEVTVERMVAKVAASYASTFSTGVKTVDGVTYTVSKVGVGQDGTKMYPVKRFNGAKLLTPDFRNIAPASTQLKSIDAAGTASMALASAIYAGENSSPENLRGEVTYAVFQATFVPDEVATVNAEGDGIELGNNPETTPATMWVIRSDEGVYFCETEADKDAIIALGILNNATFQLYHDGFCYYFIYLNKARIPEKYELHRNDFIHLEVSDLTGLGTPGKSTDGKEPEDPTDPELPVDDEPTTLRVKVTVKEWNYGKVTGVVLE